MSEKETDLRKEEGRPGRDDDDVLTPAEEAEHPAPGVKHEREPDAENIMPVEDGPGTL